MKRIFFFALTTLLIFSCAKERSFETHSSGGPPPGGGNSTYFFQAKVDGTVHSFNSNASANINDFGTGLKSLSLTGFASADTNNLEGINLSINFFAGSPKAGTYSQDYTGSEYVTAGIYNPNSTTVVYGAGLTTNTVSPLTITISKIDNTEVAGTFKGAFYKTDVNGGPASSEFLQFTDGSFRLPIR
jgi:hypothetical protein